jgi:hypothetical protein
VIVPLDAVSSTYFVPVLSSAARPYGRETFSMIRLAPRLLSEASASTWIFTSFLGKHCVAELELDRDQADMMALSDLAEGNLLGLDSRRVLGWITLIRDSLDDSGNEDLHPYFPFL